MKWAPRHNHIPAGNDDIHFSHKLLKVTILVKSEPFEEKGFYASQLNTCIGSIKFAN